MDGFESLENNEVIKVIDLSAARQMTEKGKLDSCTVNQLTSIYSRIKEACTFGRLCTTIELIDFPDTSKDVISHIIATLEESGYTVKYNGKSILIDWSV